MPRHVEAWVDGEALSTLGPYWIQQVYEDAPVLEITEGERPGRSGQLMLTRKRQALHVAIEAVIAERFDLGLRTHYLEEMARWAKPDGQPHVLELSNHPERRLTVICTGEPALAEARNYAANIRMEFTAYTVPYWEDLLPTVLTLTGTDEAESLMIPGTVPSPVSLTVTPSSGTLSSLIVTAGGSTVSLSGLSAAAGQQLRFERDGRDNLLIRCGAQVLLSKRSAASADDLLAGPGPVSVGFTADTACEAVFTARGRWA